MIKKALPKFNITTFEVAYLFEFKKWIHVFCNKKIIDINEFCSKCNKAFKEFSLNSILFFNKIFNEDEDDEKNNSLNLKSYINGSAIEQHYFLSFKSNAIFNLVEDDKFLRIFYNEFEIEI
ncbi:hypothetical protein [Spiroplasma endosymbiont of Atherix ibis]|uniref:hypothetical protein n=1 Tax=Spiroplasma endosymbiont of Atherix ibis TaxID=3066291 RepID=UPI0030CDD261